MIKTFKYEVSKGNVIVSHKNDEEFFDEFEIIEYEADRGRLIEGLTNLVFDEFFSRGLNKILGTFGKNLAKENNPQTYLKFINTLLRTIRKCIEDMFNRCNLDEFLVELYEDNLKEYFKRYVLDVI